MPPVEAVPNEPVNEFGRTEAEETALQAEAMASVIAAGKLAGGALAYATSFEGRSRFISTQPASEAVTNEWANWQSLEPSSLVRNELQQNIEYTAAMMNAGMPVNAQWAAYSNWLNGIDDGHSLGSGWDGVTANFYGVQGWYNQIRKTGHNF